MKITALIPARKNSERFPGKNYTLFLDKPLFIHSVDFAKNSDLIDEFYVTTNDEIILSICQEKSIPYIERPNQYCRATSTNSEYIKHFLDTIVLKKNELPDVLVILQPTDPFRKGSFLKEMIELYLKHTADCVFTVIKSKTKMGRIKEGVFLPSNYKFEQRFQDMDDFYEENGMLYLINVRTFLQRKSMHGKINVPYIIPEIYRNMDIDTELEMRIAEFIYKKLAIKDKVIIDEI